MKKKQLLMVCLATVGSATLLARGARGMDLITFLVKQGPTDATPEQQRKFAKLVQEVKDKDPKQLNTLYPRLGEKMTPLMFAAYYAQPTYVSALLEAGADSSITSKGPLKLKASEFVFMVIPNEKKTLATELHVIKHPGSNFDPRGKTTITKEDRKRLNETAGILINHEASQKKPKKEKRRV